VLRERQRGQAVGDLDAEAVVPQEDVADAGDQDPRRSYIRLILM
jgi:hypothetical protein